MQAALRFEIENTFLAGLECFKNVQILKIIRKAVFFDFSETINKINKKKESYAA